MASRRELIPVAGRIDFATPGDVWIFAYGSLMWDPGFAVAETYPARLHGYHRAFCVSSTSYRGTPGDPGLVLGLDRGGSCLGRALRCRAADRDEAAAYLQTREMREAIYICRRVRLRMPGRDVSGYALVVDRGNPLYAGKIAFDAAARRIARCRGARGANADYLDSTVEHLDDLGIGDGPLHRLRDAVRTLTAGA